MRIYLRPDISHAEYFLNISRINAGRDYTDECGGQKVTLLDVPADDRHRLFRHGCRAAHILNTGASQVSTLSWNSAFSYQPGYSDYSHLIKYYI